MFVLQMGEVCVYFVLVAPPYLKVTRRFVLYFPDTFQSFCCTCWTFDWIINLLLRLISITVT